MEQVLAELTNPVALSVYLAIAIKLIKSNDWGKLTEAVKDRKAQAWVIGVSLVYVIGLNLYKGTFILLNTENMAIQATAMVGINVLVYEYGIKNFISFYKWAKEKIKKI